MEQNYFASLPNSSSEEVMFLKQYMGDMTDAQANQFIGIYRDKRKDPQNIMIFTIIGLVAIAGIQRFYIGQIGMGILYLLTGGLCLIGTIIDLINYKSIALEANKKIAAECAQMMRMF